ncbi:MAG TPA: hypothetical protein VGC09_06560 [Rhodopila sp.]
MQQFPVELLELVIDGNLMGIGRPHTRRAFARHNLLRGRLVIESIRSVADFARQVGSVRGSFEPTR